MPFVASASRALSAATLFIALAGAQQCFYPDGTPSDDVPCSNSSDASCCGATAWCMDNGLCFRGGLVTRGSCTDLTWNSDACTAYCRTASPSTSVVVTPCTADGSFSCGLDSCQNSSDVFSMSGSGSFVLRASQVESLVAPALAAADAASSSSATSLPDPSTLFTAAQLAGLGCGLGVPLLFAILTIIFLVYTRRRQHQPYSAHHSLDPRTDIRLQPPTRISEHPPLRAMPRDDGSERGSFQYARSSTSSQPEHMKAWGERYRVVTEKVGPPVRVQEIRIELDASAEVKPPRHELSAPARGPR